MIELHNDDCLKIMSSIQDGSIDLIITDPPYYSTSLHFDRAERIDFKRWLIECKRVLKPSGVLVSFSDFNLLAELRSCDIFTTSYELVWQKTMSTGFLDANKRPLRNHEFIGVFTDRFNESTYNPQKTKGDPYGIKSRKPDRMAHTNKARSSSTVNDGYRYPSSVLLFGNGNSGSLHPTQKPLYLISWIMRTYSNEGDMIMDCFMGSGTVGHAATLLNRRFIGCELDTEYFKIAKSRIADANHDLVNHFGIM